MSTTRTKTTTRVTTETEEVELYECPGCGQFVEDEELLPILVNVSPSKADSLAGPIPPDQSKTICRYCADATWDYDPDETDSIREALETAETVIDTARRLFWKALPIVVSVLVVAVIGTFVFTEVTQAIDQMGAATTSPAFEQSTSEMDGATKDLLDFGLAIMGPMVVIITLLSILNAATTR